MGIPVTSRRGKRFGWLFDIVVHHHPVMAGMNQLAHRYVRAMKPAAQLADIHRQFSVLRILRRIA